jgi:hypothetical protein
MTDHDDVQHRQTFEARPGDAEVRQPEGEDGLFRVRLPVTSTAEARDGVAFDRDRVEGFREQIDDGDVGVFLDHGRNYDVAESRYSALGKIGYWDDPEIRERNGEAELWPEAVIADPDRMDDDVGDIRAILAWLKRQAELGIPIATSVGWAEDTGDRDLPGEADLLEISIVGIPSDPATTTTASSDPAALARAVSAASEGFDAETFVRELRQAEGIDTVHEPTYDEAANPDDVAWDGLDLEDFEAVTDDPSPQDPVVYNKFLHSETGFPPAEDAEFDSLGFEVVDVDGTLLLQALEDALDALPAGDLTDEEREAMQELIVELAAAEFPDAGLGEQTSDHTMTEDTTESGEDPDDTNESDDVPDAEAFRSEMLEMQRQQTETLDTLAEAIRQDDEEDEDDGEDDEDEDEDEDEDDDMDEESADADDEDVRDEMPDADRTVTLDGEEMTVDEARNHIADLREDAADAEPEEPSTQDRAEGDDDEDSTDDDTTNTTSGFGLAAREER